MFSKLCIKQNKNFIYLNILYLFFEIFIHSLENRGMRKVAGSTTRGGRFYSQYHPFAPPPTPKNQSDYTTVEEDDSSEMLIVTSDDAADQVAFRFCFCKIQVFWLDGENALFAKKISYIVFNVKLVYYLF